jgi:hypothetical protein
MPSHPFFKSERLETSEPYKYEKRIERQPHPFENYIHQPLLPRHIRLLAITSGSEDFCIIHTSLDTAPTYSSVSYSWNNQLRDHDLQIDGSNLKVIENIRTALPHLIKQASTQFLWIDEICIDQENNEERAGQIRLMSDIYTKCLECLIWLGEGTPESDIAIEAIPRISQLLKLHDPVLVWEREGIAVRSPNVLDSPLWKGLVYIFSRPWFRRVWTFQEAVLPENVRFLCGGKVLAFRDIEPMAMDLLNHLSSLQVFFHNSELGEKSLFAGFLRVLKISSFKNKDQEPKEPLDTLKLLYFTRPLTASNRLDKIYGILGLADKTLTENLKMDYRSTDIQVSRQVAEWYTSFGKDLFILNLASSCRHYRHGLPSWIPYFPRLGSHWCIGVIWWRFRTGMHQESVPRPFASTFSGELHVRGMSIDLVTHLVSYSSKSCINRADKFRNILDWEEACLAVSRSVFGEQGSSVPVAHWTTMISGICDKNLKPCRSNYDRLKSFLKEYSDGENLPPELDACNQDLVVQIRRFCQVLKLGTFFCTQNARIGLGPISTLPGDQICIFYKGFTPFILRPKPGPELGLRYHLVGDSYTYSLMGNEAFQPESRKPDETFILI